MTFFFYLAAVKMILLGAVYGRIDGGGIANINEWVERSLIMFFFVLACALFADLWALVAYAGVIGIATGHGNYFLNRMVKAVEPERTGFFVSWFFGDDPRTNEKYKHLRHAGWQYATEQDQFEISRDMQTYGMKKLYWRNVFGMFVTGFLVGLPASILSICFGMYLPAAIFACTGFAKAFAYMISDRLFDNTEGAEYINGGLRNVICLLVIVVIFLYGNA